MPQYEVTLQQSYLNQQVINRWNYISDAIPTGSLGSLLALVGMGFVPFEGNPAFGSGTFAGLLQERQHSATQWIAAIGKNIHDPTDYYAYAFPAGTVSLNGGSDATSPVIAVGYATDRTRSDVRRGQKRFCGIVEAEMGGGGVLTGEATPVWQAIGDTMADINLVPVGGSGVTFTPYVFGRKKEVDEDGKVSYPYWPTDAEQLAHAMRINAWTLKTAIRTQGTRQYGRGA